jgi:site-specific recombinase XerD
MDLSPMPAGSETLARYVQHLAAKGKSVATVERALTAVASAHIEHDEQPPLRLAANDALRTYAHEQAEVLTARRASPVTVSVLRAMLATCSSERAIGIRDRALLVLGFATGARRSELAALDISDVTEIPTGLEVAVGNGRYRRNPRLPYGGNPDTCPVRTMRAWRDLLRENGYLEGPLFVRVDRHGYLGHCASGAGGSDGRLSDRGVANVVARCAHRAGLDPEACWSGHSLRRGMTVETYRTGADPVSIAQHGGWQSGSRALHANFSPPEGWTANPLLGVDL